MNKGLIALANAANKGWFWGHYGATYIASQSLLSDFDFNSDIRTLIKQKTEDTLAKHQDLFQEFDLGPFDPNWKDRIIKTIQINLQRLRTGGHGTIYGAYALKALSENENYACQNLITGIIKLIELSNHDELTRYYDIANYDLVKFEDIANFSSAQDMIKMTFNELADVYPSQNIEGKHYFFTGEKVHLVTHAHSLIMLAELGYPELTVEGFKNQRQYIKLARQKPPSAKKLGLNKNFEPKEYWSQANLDPHHIKLPYSIFSLLKTFNQEPCKETALKFLASNHLGDLTNA